MKAFRNLALLSALLAASASLAQAEPIGGFSFNSPFVASQAFSTGIVPTGGMNLLDALLFGSFARPSAMPSSNVHFVDAGPVSTIAASSETFSLSSAPILSGIDPSVLNFTTDTTQAATTNTVSAIYVPAMVSAIAVEPSTLVLLGTGMLSAAVFYRRRRFVA